MAICFKVCGLGENCSSRCELSLKQLGIGLKWILQAQLGSFGRAREGRDVWFLLILGWKMHLEVIIRTDNVNQHMISSCSSSTRPQKFPACCFASAIFAANVSFSKYLPEPLCRNVKVETSYQSPKCFVPWAWSSWWATDRSVGRNLRLQPFCACPTMRRSWKKILWKVFRLLQYKAKHLHQIALAALSDRRIASCEKPTITRLAIWWGSSFPHQINPKWRFASHFLWSLVDWLTTWPPTPVSQGWHRTKRFGALESPGGYGNWRI